MVCNTLTTESSGDGDLLATGLSPVAGSSSFLAPLVLAERRYSSDLGSRFDSPDFSVVLTGRFSLVDDVGVSGLLCGSGDVSGVCNWLLLRGTTTGAICLFAILRPVERGRG